MSEFNNHHEALKDFLKAADILVDNWDDEYPTLYQGSKYPDYLPSFDEFVADMRQMLLHEGDERLTEWKETIQ